VRGPRGGGLPAALAAVLAVLLAVVLLVGLFIRPPPDDAAEVAGDPPPETAPSPAAVPTGSPAVPSGTQPAAEVMRAAQDPTEGTGTATDPGPEGPPPEALDEIAHQVAALRGLPYVEPLDARVVPPSALGAKYSDLAFAELDLEDLAGDQRLLVALRLIGPDTDLLAVVDALYREQVLGIYVAE
jgi:hypothetical protein